jgi:hypothetical protein
LSVGRSVGWLVKNESFDVHRNWSYALFSLESVLQCHLFWLLLLNQRLN